jgi:hypothetical protein
LTGVEVFKIPIKTTPNGEVLPRAQAGQAWDGISPVYAGSEKKKNNTE